MEDGNIDAYLASSKGYDFGKSIVLEEELDKIRLVLRGTKGFDLKTRCDRPK